VLSQRDLNNTRVIVMWGGKGAERDSSVKPGSWFRPKHPLGAFLEPSVRLVEWRQPQPRSHCWRPLTQDANPCPWPLGDSPRWVEAKTVHLGGGTVERQGEVTAPRCLQRLGCRFGQQCLGLGWRGGTTLVPSCWWSSSYPGVVGSPVTPTKWALSPLAMELENS